AMRMLEDDRMTSAHRTADGVCALGLDYDDSHGRPRVAEGEREPGDEPAAAHGNDDELHVRQVVEYLETDRPLARDDEGIRVRMDERLALLAFDAVREREGVVVDIALEQDLGAVRLAHADDRVGHAPRHH